jgi:hypothetical protein
MTKEVIDFSSLEIIKIPVKVGPKSFTLIEASEDAAARYEDAKTSCAKDYVDGKPTRIEGAGALDIFLLTQCLIDDETGKYVTEDTVKVWPHRVVNKLASRAKDISDLHTVQKRLETALKNGSGATPDISE